MPTPIEEITLPYSKTIDSCGSVTYQASQDLRPADGRKVEVAFVDSSNMTCEIAPVDVQTLSVKIVNARGKRTSYTAVNKLQVGSEDPSVRDDAAIYEALNVEEEVLNPGIAGRSRTRKSVGGLVCTKSVLAAPRATPGYTCKLAN